MSLTDDELRARWRAAGGTFHGPHVETGTMPESMLLPFLRDLVIDMVGEFAIKTEGMLLEKLGRLWAPNGPSIQALIAQLQPIADQPVTDEDMQGLVSNVDQFTNDMHPELLEAWCAVCKAIDTIALPPEDAERPPRQTRAHADAVRPCAYVSDFAADILGRWSRAAGAINSATMNASPEQRGNFTVPIYLDPPTKEQP